MKEEYDEAAETPSIGRSGQKKKERKINTRQERTARSPVSDTCLPPPRSRTPGLVCVLSAMAGIFLSFQAD